MGDTSVGLKKPAMTMDAGESPISLPATQLREVVTSITRNICEVQIFEGRAVNAKCKIKTGITFL